MKLLAVFGLGVFSIALAGCFPTAAQQPAPAAPPKTGAQDGAYSSLFAQLQKAAQVAADDNYSHLVERPPLINSAVAPKDLRDMLTSWHDAAQHRMKSEVRVEDGRIALTWQSTMSVVEQSEQGLAILHRQLKSCGLKQVDAPTSAHAKANFQELQRRSRPSNTRCFRRQTGEVLEEILADVQGGMVGGDHNSQVTVHWSASLPYAGPAPSLDQLAAALPQFKQRTAPPNDESLLDIVRDQPMLQGAVELPRLDKPSPYTGFEGVFPAQLREGYEAELKTYHFTLFTARAT